MPERTNQLPGNKIIPASASADIFSGQATAGRNIHTGNVQQLPIQRKLAVGAVDDPLEHEADAMADQVMRMPEPNFVQRKCAHCEDDEAQRKPIASFIQRKETGKNETTSEATHNQIESTRGGGNALPADTKTFMERRFGNDFSNVRIHSGAYASQLSNELNAQAFTVGNDIYFNDGKFSPGSSDGKHLLAHELTHTMQQSGNNKTSVQQIQKQSTGGTSTPPAANGGLTPEMLTQIARRLREAMKGWGTDEDAIYAALSGRTQEQTDAIASTYQTLFNRVLITDLQDELNDDEMLHLSIFSPALVTDKKDTPAKQAQSFADSVAMQLHKAMEGWGTDESSIYAALTGRTQDELSQIKLAYQQLTHNNLEADLRDELSGSDLTRTIRLLNQGLLQPEDELYLAMEGLGTDEDTIFRVLDSLKGHDTAIIAMENEYRNKYGDLVADLRGDLSSSEYAKAMKVLGPVIQDAAFEDCNPAIINEVRSYIPIGIQKVEHAIAVLSKGLAHLSAAELLQLNTYFDPGNTGGIDQQFVNEVLSNFRQIRNEFNNDLTIECETDSWLCKRTRLYYTYFGNIHVCPYFSSETDSNRKAQDLVHELGHNAMHARDREYANKPAFQNLTPRGTVFNQIPVVGYLVRVISASDTLYNPDSYSLFAFNVP